MGKDSGQNDRIRDDDHPAGVARGGEESLLEQIRTKEEELHTRITEAEREYSDRVDAQRQAAGQWLLNEQKSAETEAASYWEQAMETVHEESDRVQKAGEERIRVHRERKKRNFDAAIDLVVQAVKSG